LRRFTLIDLHSHILPGLDDGASTWEDSLEMARLAVEDGIRTMVASPHLYKSRKADRGKINLKAEVLAKINEFKEKLLAEGIDLEILPGCDFPLSYESLQLLDDDQVLTINDGNRYLLLEFPDASLPPASEDICFRLQSKGITPIITHPERHFIFHEMPRKLQRLLDLGCLAQVTASSLTGGFGRSVARVAREMMRQGYFKILATDAHDTRKRPPLLRQALEKASSIVGQEQALAMVTSIPEKIIRGEPCF
jgi:protein-tyrosine phosphatase